MTYPTYTWSNITFGHGNKSSLYHTTTMPNTTVQPERKPAFARPSGTTTSATAPAAKRNTITDSSTASDRCMCSSLESSHDPTKVH